MAQTPDDRTQEYVLRIRDEVTQATQRIVDEVSKVGTAWAETAAKTAAASAQAKAHLDAVGVAAANSGTRIVKSHQEFLRALASGESARMFDPAVDGAQAAEKSIGGVAAASEVAQSRVARLGASVGIASAGLRDLGADGAASVLALASRLTMVADGAGALGATIAAIGSSLWAVARVQEAVASANAAALDDWGGRLEKTIDVTKHLSAANRAFTDAAVARQRGVTVETVQTERAIEQERAAIESARQSIEKLRAEGPSAITQVQKAVAEIARYEYGEGLGDFAKQLILDADPTGARQLESRLRGFITSTTSSIEQREEALQHRLAAIYQARADSWAQAELSRVIATRDAAQRIATETEALASRLALIESGKAGTPARLAQVDSDEAAAIAEARRAAAAPLRATMERELLSAQQAGQPTADISAHWTAQIEKAVAGVDVGAIGRKFKLLRDLIHAEAKRNLDTALLGFRLDSVGIERSLATIGMEQFTARRMVVADQEAEELRSAERLGKDLLEIKARYANAYRQIDVDAARARADLDRSVARSAEDAARDLAAAQAEAGADPRDAVASIRRSAAAELAARAAEEARRREDLARTTGLTADEIARLTQESADRRLAIEARAGIAIRDLTAETHRSIARSTDDFLRDIENLRRTSLDAQLADEDARHARALEDAKRTAASREDLEREHLARLARIQASAATVSGQRQQSADRLRLALDDPAASGSDGFAAQVEVMRRELLTSAEIGAQAAQVLQDGFTNAFASIASGSVTAGEAFKRFGLSIVDTAVRIMTQRAVAQLLGSFLSSAAGSYTEPTSGVGSTTTAGGLEVKAGNPYSGAFKSATAPRAYRIAEGSTAVHQTFNLNVSAMDGADAKRVLVREKGTIEKLARNGVERAMRGSNGMRHRVRRTARGN